MRRTLSFSACSGSSPRGRGTRLASGRMQRWPENIGSSPRGRGTLPADRTQSQPSGRHGSSPRGRGTHRMPIASDQRRCPASDHPRVGGERAAASGRGRGVAPCGSSPRGRGTRILGLAFRPAGDSPDHPRVGGERLGHILTQLLRWSSDHPRVGGERSIRVPPCTLCPGRIIPAWAGNAPSARYVKPRTRRIIPAWAGNATSLGTS